jgi:hypothetical protein
MLRSQRERSQFGRKMGDPLHGFQTGQLIF